MALGRAAARDPLSRWERAQGEGNMDGSQSVHEDERASEDTTRDCVTRPFDGLRALSVGGASPSPHPITYPRYVAAQPRPSSVTPAGLYSQPIHPSYPRPSIKENR